MMMLLLIMIMFMMTIKMMTDVDVDDVVVIYSCYYCSIGFVVVFVTY